MRYVSVNTNLAITDNAHHNGQPRYIPGTIGCAVCFGLEFCLIVIWRFTLVMRNRRRDKMMAEQGMTEEERIKKGKEMGEQDFTDFQNPYVSLVSITIILTCLR